jgi:sugar phosphate isomerase/epimerase
MLDLAVQLYSLRTLPDLATALDAVSDAGYGFVETVHTQGMDAHELKDMLAARGLNVCSAHVALEHLENDLDATLKAHKTLETPLLVVPFVPAERRPQDRAGWQALGKHLAGIATRCHKAGFDVAYHNHDFELVDVGGQLALDVLLEASQLGLELDLGWVARAGHHPLENLRHYADTCVRLHVKDVAVAGENTDEDGWADVGAGVLTWGEILAEAKQLELAYLIVEHDLPKDPVATIQNSATFLRDALASL